VITPKQEKWIEHLSNETKVRIVPFDSTAEEKFQIIKNKIQSSLGAGTLVIHRGATSLGISGQDEIDIYIPVSLQDFDKTVPFLENIFGAPRSLYPLERARFVTEVDGKHIDLFLINNTSEGWLDGITFEAYLRKHPETLKAYEQLKEGMNGFSTREFYRRKIEFINDVLSKTK